MGWPPSHGARHPQSGLVTGVHTRRVDCVCTVAAKPTLRPAPRVVKAVHTAGVEGQQRQVEQPYRSQSNACGGSRPKTFSRPMPYWHTACPSFPSSPEMSLLLLPRLCMSSRKMGSDSYSSSR